MYGNLIRYLGNYLLKIKTISQQKLDKSYLFYGVVWGIICGICVAYLSRRLNLIIAFSVTILVFILIMWRFKIQLFKILFFFGFGMMIGWLRGNLIFTNSQIFEQYIGQTLNISGIVSEDVITFESGTRSITLTKSVINHHPVVGKLLIKTRQSALIERGDMLELTAKIEPGVGPYVATIRNIEIMTVTNFGDPPTRLRDWLAGRLERFLPSQQFSLVSAILLGKRQTINRELSHDIRTVGLSHMVVASGLHLIAITELVRKLFHKFSRRVELIGSLVVAILFASVTGLTASMFRALITLTFNLIAWYYGRKFSGGRLISLLVAISLLINPLYLAGDLSWSLSYAAFFGILVVVPIVKDFFFGDQQLNQVTNLILSVLVVQIVVSPILLNSFGNLSLIAIVANLLIVPCLVPLMILASGLIISSGFAIVAQVFNYLLQLLDSYVLAIIKILAAVPLASVELQVSSTKILIITMAMLLIIWLMFICNQKTKIVNLK